MGIALMFLLALYQMQSAIHSEIIESPNFSDNALQQAEDIVVANAEDRPGEGELLDTQVNEGTETELEFRYPISAIGIDYAKNSVVLRFQKHPRKPRYKYDPELERKRQSLKDNFMHFGKRQPEQLQLASGPDYYEVPMKRSYSMDRYGRDPKQDFMRFGRASSDFMRFGRAPSDFMRFGRAPSDFMRFGRDPKQDFMRFGRDPKQDFMRFGRDPKQDFMRFGRDPKQDFMRFGRDPKQDFMRFGRPDNFMRFGRSMQVSEDQRDVKQDFVRYGRPDNFMRFGRSTPFERDGKMDTNFMRFGKSIPAASGEAATSESNQTKSQDKLEAVGGDSKPMDKALNALFNKQQQQQGQAQEHGQQQEEPHLKSGEQTESHNNLDEGSVEELYEP